MWVRSWIPGLDRQGTQSVRRRTVVGVGVAAALLVDHGVVHDRRPAVAREALEEEEACIGKRLKVARLRDVAAVLNVGEEVLV